ncbi:hypothetical protein QYM36_008695 [Artemia franciscana]|uniref:INO80 complex subunit E N-terminal domain-containing protein n=1 Tax=Artemia franciscana TaxID=6661 RepID=A0AA88HS15_ARTSF|nr:hypothetical protein QYM36_008695 [Artemia franciscana]
MDNCDSSVADPKKQYKILKRLTKELVIENACLCDTVDLLGKRLYILEQERKFLLKRLLQKKQMKASLSKETEVETATTSSSKKTGLLNLKQKSGISAQQKSFRKV